MVDAALHSPRHMCVCVFVCISAVLQQQKTNAAKGKKKRTQEMFAKFKDSCSGDVAVAVTFDAAVGCTTACLAAPLPLHALHKLCGFAFVSLTLSHSVTLCCVHVYVCACVCFCLRLLCAFHFQFTAVPKLYLKANFAVAFAVSACVLSVQIQVQGAAEADALLPSHSPNAISMR